MVGEVSPALFELEMLGDAFERRYRKMRPEVAVMPWGTLDLTTESEPARLTARATWTRAAYQEYRTAIACCAALRALFEARAPLDLIALATRFPLDELVHVELCARMAMECGGGTELVFDPQHVIVDPDVNASPLQRAAIIATRTFCVGEAISVPLLRGAWRASRHPLPRAVLGRIVKDEAAHGVFGYAVLDWALPNLRAEDVDQLGRAADEAIAALRNQWNELSERPAKPADETDTHGWMRREDYLTLAKRSLQTKVIAPLVDRGIPIARLGPSL
jgi:hypothetical protein